MAYGHFDYHHCISSVCTVSMCINDRKCYNNRTARVHISVVKMAGMGYMSGYICLGSLTRIKVVFVIQQLSEKQKV